MKTGQYNISWGAHKLDLGQRTCIMGILNVTPDSFSDGGLYFSHDDAVAMGEKMVKDGADIIDIGGESTRPFSEPVSIENEIQRVVPVIKDLAKRISVPVSIDTTKAEVARKAIEAGASIVNDISALNNDDKMVEVAAEYRVPVILMHMLGTPETMQIVPRYDDLFGEIKDFFKNAVAKAEKNGIERSKIIIDPGIGFGKTVEHNLLLIKNLHKFNDLNLPVLIGPSRKAFIRKLLQNKAEEEVRSDQPEAETGTQAAVAAAVLNGAHIIRVHNVSNSLNTIKIIDAIKNVISH